MKIFPVRRKLWLVLTLTGCLFLFYTAVGERGLLGLNRMVNQRNDLRSMVRALEESNVELAEQVSRLRDDPATIELASNSKEASHPRMATPLVAGVHRVSRWSSHR